eukprot:3937098-Rhodomonas_salina.2
MPDSPKPIPNGVELTSRTANGGLGKSSTFGLIACCSNPDTKMDSAALRWCVYSRWRADERVES